MISAQTLSPTDSVTGGFQDNDTGVLQFQWSTVTHAGLFLCPTTNFQWHFQKMQTLPLHVRLFINVRISLTPHVLPVEFPQNGKLTPWTPLWSPHGILPGLQPQDVKMPLLRKMERHTGYRLISILAAWNTPFYIYSTPGFSQRYSAISVISPLMSRLPTFLPRVW